MGRIIFLDKLSHNNNQWILMVASYVAKKRSEILWFSVCDALLMSLMSLMGDCISQPTDFQQCPKNNVQYETNYKNKATNTHTRTYTEYKTKTLSYLHTKN